MQSKHPSNLKDLTFTVQFSAYTALKLSSALSSFLVNPNGLTTEEKLNILNLANGLTDQALKAINKNG